MKLSLLLLAASLVAGCAHLPVPKPSESIDIPEAEQSPFDFAAAQKQRQQERERRCQRLSDLDFWTGFASIGLSAVSTTLGVIGQTKENSPAREHLLDVAVATGGGATLSTSLQKYVQATWSSECAE